MVSILYIARTWVLVLQTRVLGMLGKGMVGKGIHGVAEVKILWVHLTAFEAKMNEGNREFARWYKVG